MTEPDGAENLDTSTTNFLLAEHTRLCQLYLSTRETADRRVNLFLTLTTTAVGVVVAATQLRFDMVQLVETALAASIGLLLLGLITFNRLLERSMQSTEYLRAINRIHRYFVDRAPDTAPYLFWPAHDDLPHYDARGIGGAETREVVLLINCVFFGIAVGLCALLALGLAQAPWAALIGGAAFVVALFAHNRFELWALEREETRKRILVKFPHPEDMHTNRVMASLEDRKA